MSDNTIYSTSSEVVWFKNEVILHKCHGYFAHKYGI